MYKLVTLVQLVSLLGFRGSARFMQARLGGAGSMTVRLRSGGDPLTVRFNNSDLVLLLGVFLHGDCHLRLDPPPALILDLGANVGLTARAWANQFPDARIVAVEPDAETFSLCQRNTANHAGTTCLNRIAGPAAGRGAPTNPGVISMAQQFAALPAGAGYGDGIRISPIEELLDEHPSAGPILVKMDIEGSEVAIFGQDGPWLDRVHGIIVEPHGDGTADLIHRTLARRGFTLHQVGEKILGLRSPWSWNGSNA